MRKNTLLNTTFSTAVSFKKQADEAVKFIITNNQLCVMDSFELKGILKKSEQSIKTPLTDLFLHFSDYFKTKTIPFTVLNIKITQVPEILSTSSVMIDCGEIMKHKMDGFDNVIVNLTNFLTLNKKHGSEQLITDSTSIQNLFTRALLCSSYNRSEESLWLPPKLCVFIIKTFDTILTTLIRNVYNINDIIIIKKLSFLISLYMVQKLIPERDLYAKPEFMYRLPFGNTSEIDSLFNMIEDTGFVINKQVTLPILIELIKSICGERFNSFDIHKIFKIFGSGSLDKTFSAITLEYPPYWVYQLLDIASGGRHPIYNTIFRNTKIKPEISAFAYELNRTYDLFSNIES